MRAKQSGGAIQAISVGVILSLMISAAAIMLITQAALTGRIGEKGIDIFLAVSIGIATLCGGQAAVKQSHKSKAVMCTVTGSIYLMTLFVLGMCMEGAFTNPIKTLAAAGIGIAISCALCFKKPSVRRRGKRGYR